MIKLDRVGQCPCCHAKLDGVTDPYNKDSVPSAHDVTICVYCQTFLEFGDDLTLRELTEEDIASLPDNVRNTLIRFRSVLARSPLNRHKR